jgi:hypothetical protein
MKLTSAKENYVRVSFVEAKRGPDGKMVNGKTQSFNVYETTADEVIKLVTAALQAKSR